MTYQADRPFTIYFVRHGITEPNFRGFRCGGDLDLPMMDIGCDQAYLLAKQIEQPALVEDAGIRRRRRPGKILVVVAPCFRSVHRAPRN